MMGSVVTALVGVLMVRGLALVVLWLNLRARLLQSRSRHRFLVTLARTLPVGSQINHRCRGDELHVTLGRGTTDRLVD